MSRLNKRVNVNVSLEEKRAWNTRMNEYGFNWGFSRAVRSIMRLEFEYVLVCGTIEDKITDRMIPRTTPVLINEPLDNIVSIAVNVCQAELDLWRQLRNRLSIKSIQQLVIDTMRDALSISVDASSMPRAKRVLTFDDIGG